MLLDISVKRRVLPYSPIRSISRVLGLTGTIHIVDPLFKLIEIRRSPLSLDPVTFKVTPIEVVRRKPLFDVVSLFVT